MFEPWGKQLPFHCEKNNLLKESNYLKKKKNYNKNKKLGVGQGLKRGSNLMLLCSDGDNS